MESKNNRPTIGFLASQLFDEYGTSIWSAIAAESEKYDVNLLCFIGGAIEDEHYFEYQRNPIYDLINKNKIDGLILVANQLSQFVGPDGLKKFNQKYSPVPIVNIGVEVENYPCILTDNRAGIRDVMIHLIKAHGCKEIAFIHGPRNSQEAMLRYTAYKEVLSEYNLVLNNDLIIDGDFQDGSYAKSFSDFLNKNLTYDAIVSSNDYMAVRIMKALQKQKIMIPDDVAVTGFDYNEQSRSVIPKLTTVSQPKYDIGLTAFKTMLSLLNNEKVPAIQMLPTKLIVQQSCGCTISFESAGSHKQAAIPIKKHSLSHEEKRLIVHAIEQEIGLHCIRLSTEEKKSRWAEDLTEGIITHIKEKTDAGFFNQLQNMVMQGIGEGMDVYSWYKIITKLFDTFYNYSGDADRRSLEKLYNTSIVSIGDIIDHLKSESEMQYRKRLLALYEVTERLNSIFDMSLLKKAFAEVFPSMGINSYYVSCYTDSPDERRDAELLFYKNGNHSIPRETQAGKADELMVNIIATIEKRVSFVVMALFYRDIKIGFILCEIGPLDGTIYEGLSVQLSSALRSIELINEIKQYSEELEVKVRERTVNLQRAKEELEQANLKLRELDMLKNDFIANITHDFRSPLTAILNTADLALKLKTQTPEENHENYNVIYASSLRLRKSIDRLLDLAKIDAHGITLKVSKVNIVTLFNSIIDFYSSSVTKTGIKIIRKLPDAEIKDVYIDTEKFEEIIHNIMSNAIKFVDPQQGIITALLSERDDTIQIRIADNGIGIAKEKLESIFNRFEQGHNDKTKEMFRGTGIGLSFAKQLVEYMKGRIWAESKGEGKGAAFIIEFPTGKGVFNESEFLKDEPLPKKYNDEKVIIKHELEKKLGREEIFTYFAELNKENEFDHKKAKILIIDDDKNIKRIVMNYLINYNYVNFIIASDGKQGLDAVYEYSPDLILCDYNMPYVKGDALHDEVLKNPNFKYIPFIFLSAIADDKIMIERREKGACAYLMKPIDEKDLLLTIEQQLKQYFVYRRILQQATIDELTGLYTRRVILHALTHELYSRKYRDLSIIFFDIDSFKLHNDTMGHQTGDNILATVGKIVSSGIRQYDMAGRYGGDEFLIILPDTNQDQALTVAGAIRTKIKMCTMKDNKNGISLSASFGVVSLKDNAEYISEVLKISNLHGIYEIDDPNNADWKKIEKYKKGIGPILINMADTALYQAKSPFCKKCGYIIKKTHNYQNSTCPKCHAGPMAAGGDSVVVFVR